MRVIYQFDESRYRYFAVPERTSMNRLFHREINLTNRQQTATTNIFLIEPASMSR